MSFPAGRGIPLPNGSVRLPSGHTARAVQVLYAIRSQAERSQVDGAIDRFHLYRNNAADVLGARAYVWATYKAPLFSDAGFSGPTNDRAAQAIMPYERAHPGTTGLADRGDQRAMNALIALANDAVAQGNVVECRSWVSPSLSTSSSAARAQVAASTRMQNWQAHHLIPFAEMANLPTNVQLPSPGRDGRWRTSSRFRRIARPNWHRPTTRPSGTQRLPYALQYGSIRQLGHLRTNGANMTDA